MKNTRRGLGKGLGCGYKNIVPIDHHIHSMSARGVKSYTLNMYGIDEIKRMNQEQARKSRGKQPYVASASTDFDAIRQIPNFGDYRPKGWKLGEVYFVDSSGMGQEGESALTINQFLKEVKAGKGYAIIEAGQFQVKIGEFSETSSEAGRMAIYKQQNMKKTIDEESHMDAKGKVQYKIMMNHIGIYSDHPPFDTKEKAEAYLKKSQEMYQRFYGRDKNKFGQDYKSAYSVVPVTMNAKKDWVDRLYGHKTSKKTKLVTKGVVYTAGALALLGASSRVLRAKGKWERMAGGYEINSKTGKVRATDKYGEFGKIHEDALKRNPTKLQLSENAIRDMFLSKQYNLKVPQKDINYILKDKRWARIYGAGNIKKAWQGLVKDGYAKKKKDSWVWGL